MPRKTNDDPQARTAAADMIEASVSETNGGDVVAVFETVEFETAKSRVAGGDVTLRRVVMTGPWTVA